MGRKVVDGAKGKRGRVFYAGQELCTLSWEMEIGGEKIDSTNSCSGSANEVEYGNDEATGTVEAQWDYAVNVFDDPPSIRRGEKVNLKLYVHSSPGVGLADGPFWEFSAGIDTVKMGVTVKEKVNYSFTFTSTGVINYPTSAGSSGG